MTTKLIEFQSSASVREALSQLLIYVESVNALCASRVRDRGVYPFLLQDAVLDVRKALQGSRRSAWEGVTLPGPIEDLVDDREFDPRLTREIAAIMLRPAKVDTKGYNLKLDRDPGLPPPGPPPEMPVELRARWILEFTGSAGLAERLHNDSEIADKELSSILWPQIVDPIGVAQVFLLGQASTSNVDIADFYIQSWLRSITGLRFTEETKLGLLSVCRHLNYLFFSQRHPSIERADSLESRLISTELLMGEIARAWRASPRLFTSDRRTSAGTHKNLDENKEEGMLPYGLFLFLRFSKIIHVTFLISGAEALSGPPQDHSRKSGTSSPLQTARASRPLEYMYFLKRVFGSISEMRGLNFIFGGGILPRARSGRSMVISGPPGSAKTIFALQKLTSLAAHGGLAVYFSLEESRELIGDRLVSFGLWDRERFTVIQAGRDLVERIEEHVKTHDERGVLVLYGLKSGKSYSLLRILDQVATVAPTKLRWRAVAVDSVNALKYDEVDGRSSEDEEDSQAGAMTWKVRERTRLLVESVENNGLLGLLISEEYGDDDDSALMYLADTVLRMGLEPDHLIRWIEIRKCRSQNFHGGRHFFRILQERGVKIYPSLAAIRSTLRRRSGRALSEDREIPIPTEFFARPVSGREGRVREQSLSVILGARGSGKTFLSLALGTAASRGIGGRRSRAERMPIGLLVLSFRTPPSRYEQFLRKHSVLLKRWEALKFRMVRWFSPGSTMTPDQVIGEIWDNIRQSRREGTPIERVIFDDLESSARTLPRLGEERLFWPTVFELLRAEGMTGFFLLEEKAGVEDLRLQLRLEVDYVMRLERGEEGEPVLEVDGRTVEGVPREWNRARR